MPFDARLDLSATVYGVLVSTFASPLARLTECHCLKPLGWIILPVFRILCSAELINECGSSAQKFPCSTYRAYGH
jgi:hypothetical protein